MPAPTKVPLKIYQGATFFESWAWSTAPDENSAYTPMALTGCTARMQAAPGIYYPPGSDPTDQ